MEPGTYRARYVLPSTNYPEVAILVALSAWPHPQSIHGAYGTMLVPLAAAVDLPGDHGAATRRSPSPSPGRRLARRRQAATAASACRW